MALNFPNTPAVNDTYTLGTKTWKWNGAGWQLEGTSKYVVIGEPISNGSAGQVLFYNTGDLIGASGNLTVNTATGMVAVGNGMQVNGQVSGYVHALTSNTINLNDGNFFTRTITAATAFVFSNPHASRAVAFTLVLTNGGAFSTTWPASVDWPGGVAPTLTAAGVDVLTFFTIDGGTIWHGVASMLDSK
jgi:hypothetical protein